MLPAFTMNTSWPLPSSPRVTFAGSISAPEYPTAQMILPQLGSAPKTAVLTRLLAATALAARRASLSLFAPVTFVSKYLLAPSPSFAIIRASSMQTYLRASEKSSSLHFTWPVAVMSTASLVLVSPSTVSMLKLSWTASFKQPFRVSAVRSASV
ncbi:MAG: hypothetical protein A4E46_00321 [Methanosaeta sp. PtaU1.Bin016]|nr:MAG: hypothetical protein A4E46_00321 [Methanosaeta sp. PtaU1.Bin016]